MGGVKQFKKDRDTKKNGAHKFIPRAQALRKLQVTLVDFRRLCILKGIYPREPKKKTAGADKTYYHVKDIKFLMHDPLMKKFAETKTWLKKYHKKMGRREFFDAKRVEAKKPVYTLHHLVKERYPTFDLALADLDDAISMVALFQSLPANKTQGVKASVVNECARLYDEFVVYVIRSGTLRKVFASIKGYYYQAEILGQTITWLTPHQFAQATPAEVDFRVLCTFCEFARTLLKFSSYKLYSMAGWAYPPQASESLKRSSGRAAAIDQGPMAGAGTVGEFAGTEEGAKQDKTSKEQLDCPTVFKGLKIFISREVPFGPLHLVARSGGAEVGFEGEGAPFGRDDPSVTHFVVDRPPEHLEMREGAEYLQPQWILDSFNCRMQLPIGEYAPGKVPPPHCSPFVDDVAEGYIPEQRKKLNELMNDKAAEVAAEQEDEASDDEVEEKFMEELKAEASGQWHSEFEAKKAEERAAMDSDDEPAKKPTREERQAAEQLERQKAVMTRKVKKIMTGMEKSAAKKQGKIDALTTKAKDIKRKAKKEKKAQQAPEQASA